jgi:peptidoglycan/LPS O-acetylase OafA/YrhL
VQPRSTTTSSEPAPLHGRILQLDGLRGGAILLVLIWHYIAVDAQPVRRSLAARALFFLRLDWSGVDLFFVLSGFLIGGILLDVRDSPTYFKAFYARRFFRIIPVYAVVCVLFAAASAAGAERWWGTGGAFLFSHPPPWYAFVFFLQNIFVAVRGTFDPLVVGVMWSLAIEEQFYLTLPLLVRLLPRERLLPVLLALVGIVPIARSIGFFTLPHGGLFAYAMMPFRADALLLGVIAAALVRDPKAWEMLQQRREGIKVAAGLLGAVLLGFMLRGWYTHEAAPICTAGYTLIALFYVCILLLAVTRGEGRLSALLRARWLRSLGGIAYGTYLFHVAVQGICFGVIFGHEPRITSWAELATEALSAAITIAIANLSWTLFEKRMVSLGHRFAFAPPP